MQIDEQYQIFLKSSGVCTDTRKLEKGNLFFALKGPNFDANKLAVEALEKGAIGAVVDDPTINEEGSILVNDGLEALQQLATHHRMQFDIPVIGITGSNGKTTTKELIASVLQSTFKTHYTRGNFNNHIGVPLTLLAMPLDTEIAIIEMGANHIGEIEQLCNIALPDFGIITNIGKAHLEGFGSFEGVAKAKSELYYHVLKHGGNIFVNSADEHLMRMASRFEQPIKFPQSGDYLEAELIGANPLLELEVQNHTLQTNLIGAYNFSNVAAALCIGKYFNVDDELARKSLEKYNPSNNRSQVIRKGSNTIVSDAYNANPSSMTAAIRNFEAMESKRKVLILGDMFELGEVSADEHRSIGKLISDCHFDEVYLCGIEMKHAHSAYSAAHFFATKDELESALEGTKIEDSTILIKGSRGMSLESLVNLL